MTLRSLLGLPLLLTLTTTGHGCAEPLDDAPPAAAGCVAGTKRCSGASFERCAEGGTWETERACGSLTCDPSLGCLACTPGEARCEAGNVVRCVADGSHEQTEVCPSDQGLSCRDGACQDLCAAAAEEHSYLGCEYWPTVTPNIVDPVFAFAVVVGNPNDALVEVRVELSDETIVRTLAPGQVDEIELPWVAELKDLEDPNHPDVLESASRLVTKGAFRLTSSLPISAYQFNPLRFAIDGSELCSPFSETNPCSTTNDASLLLPTTALGTTYLGLSWPTEEQGHADPISGPPSKYIGIPGFLSVVGTEDGTVVTVRSSAYTEAGATLAAMAPGATQQITLGRGDVLQLLTKNEYVPLECSDFTCVGGAEYDLTGTRIEADKPVAVFGGHPCAFVPYDREACDHLEEQILPLDAWGRSAIAASTKPLFDDQPNVWKLVSGSPDNTLTFDPPVHAPVTLGEGESLQFAYQGEFQVRASGRVLVGQFMVGDGYDGVGTGVGTGDPSMAIVPPNEQYRSSYDFLAPSTYTNNYVDVLASPGSAPSLDGAPVTGWKDVGTTGFRHGLVEIGPGPHHMETAEGTFGIMVYGTAWYTSYLFAGGLDAAPLAPPK